MRFKFGLWCNGERRVFGTVEFDAGKKATHEQILKTYKPLDADADQASAYDLRDNRGGSRLASDQKTPLVSDSVQVVCARCGSPVLIVESVDDGGFDTSAGVYLVPGAFSIGNKSARAAAL